MKNNGIFTDPRFKRNYMPSGLSLKLKNGAYADTPAYTVFLIMDVDKAEKLEPIFAPTSKIGYSETRPIVDAIELMKQKSGESD